ncbi:uncharacterized protein LOC116852460 isoform X2 [Odontomachus brunneus]|uniref:uncharacterized protein LOC116852460 isoform X2 n=1 Tax=Odontomachus brunneus TaxID=486640 RepID=UPI0013F258E4|nr:uncharacterized protein LOC116852460 isoform X2 [Odontomachus brunneus]
MFHILSTSSLKYIMAMSWRVVHFIKEDIVEAVPASWVKEINGCFWSPYSELKLRTLINNCAPPAHDWDVHQSRLIGDLNIARNKAAKAEETSDLTSETEGRARKIKKKRRLISESESDTNFITFNISTEERVINEDSEYSDKENEIINIPILRKAAKENAVASTSKHMANIQADSVLRIITAEVPPTVKPQNASTAYKRQVSTENANNSSL